MLHLSWRKRHQVPPKCCSHLHTTQHHITEGNLRPQYSRHSKSQISPSGSMENGNLLNKCRQYHLPTKHHTNTHTVPWTTLSYLTLFV
jgi:hypothetical protein